MSKAAYWQRGESIDFANGTGEKIEANQIVTVGALIGIAGTDIAAGETGTLHIEGVFEMPKKESEEIEAGAVVCFKDNAVEKFADGETPIGVAIAKAAAADAVVLVKINTGSAAKKE